MNPPNLQMEERIPIICYTRLIHVEYTLTAAKEKFKTEVYNGNVMDGRFYGTTRDEARNKALAFIYDTFNAPSNLDEIELLYHQPQDVDAEANDG